jgi:predicted DNA-binding transcriptional regulator AlpA
MSLTEPSSPDPLIASRPLADEFGVSTRTLYRWCEDAEMQFPRPIIINRRMYFRRAKIAAWRDSTLRKSLGIPLRPSPAEHRRQAQQNGPNE